MKNFVSTFEPELRISLTSLLVGLVSFGVMLILASDFLTDPADPFKVARLGVLALITAGIVWLLDYWRLKGGRWFAVIAMVAIVFWGHAWLATPAFLTLVVMPVALAAILINLSGAIAVAIGESLLLFLLPLFIAFEIDLGATGIVLGAIWLMVGIMFAVYYPLYETTQWSWAHFKQTQDLLEEARDRKVELQQALDDLAHAYRELTLLKERVAAMRLVAEEAQATKAAYVAKVSHEFRTPLNMIIGLTDVLVETPEIYGDTLSPALLEDLKIVHRNCKHLSSMVNDVLDLSQTETGRLTLHREWIDLAEDIDNALMVVRPLLEKKHLTLQASVPADLPRVYCDRTRIRQVILNLISNAARFTDQGGISVHAHQQDHSVVIEVIDTGPGISPEDAKRIFDPFFQGMGNLWRGQEGSGLGLSISKQFVELHGGQIWLESAPGVGSTFAFKLPISPPTPPSTRPARWVNEDWVWHERTSKSDIPKLPLKQRVVICDETGELQPLFAHTSDDVEFIDTVDLEQAISQTQRVPAHAMIVNMPSTNNLEALLEQARVVSETPLILGTFPSRIKDVLEAGAIDYLVKPVTRSDLQRVMEAIGEPIKRVLVTDDNPEVQQLLTRMLLTYDHSLTVDTASSGEEALQQLRFNPPDLMLIDIAMPGMDGWQTLKIKKQDNRIKDIPAVVISAQDFASQPTASRFLLATLGHGLSVDKFLRCSLELSNLLLQPS
jgi:signal transduction histidine kinase/CheY-like chemotaxis protein